MKLAQIGLVISMSVALFSTTAAFAEDLTFQLTNLSSRALVVFQTSPSGTDSWEEDVFGDSIMPSGNTVPVTIADGQDVCVYDMRFIMDDEAVLEHYEIDLCELGEYTLSDQ
jgi:hypothetical protein